MPQVINTNVMSLNAQRNSTLPRRRRPPRSGACPAGFASSEELLNIGRTMGKLQGLLLHKEA